MLLSDYEEKKEWLRLNGTILNVLHEDQLKLLL